LSISTRRPSTSTLFPYTTLFRSADTRYGIDDLLVGAAVAGNQAVVRAYVALVIAQRVAPAVGDLTTGGLQQRMGRAEVPFFAARSEEHTSELQSRENLVCRLLLE